MIKRLTIGTIVSADLKNIFRDKSLWVVFFVPVIFVFILRFGIPAIQSYFEALSDYYGLITAFSCMICIMMPAYVMSFIMIDERVQNVSTVLRVMPVGYGRFLIYRIAGVVVLSFVSVAILLLFGQLIEIKFFQLLTLSFTASLTSPALLFFIISIAKNKIEGVTYFKLVNSLLVLPLVYFFVDYNWVQVVGIIPVFWTYLAVEHLEGMNFYLFSGISVLMHCLLLYVLFVRVRKLV